MQQPTPLNGELIPPGQPAAVPALRPKSDEEVVLQELGEENGRTALTICDRLASEAEGLTVICCQVRGWGEGGDLDRARDAARQFYRWRIRSAALSRIYARAMQSRSHVIAHRLLEEIDSEPDPHMARVKMDAMKWLAAKFNRADFGDEPTLQVHNTINNNDTGAAAVLEELRQRLARKRKSMLSQPGGRVEVGGGGEEETAKPTSCTTLARVRPERVCQGGQRRL